MFSTKLRGGKAFATKQKIREFKKLLFKSKRLHKATKTGSLDPRKLIRKAVQNMNNVSSQKYGVPPKAVEKKSELVEMQKDTNVTTFVSIRKLEKNYAVH